MKKTSRRIIKILITLTALALSAVIFILVKYDAAYGYDYPNRDFADNGKNEPYAREIPLHEMDFTVYTSYFPQASSLTLTHYEEMIVLPCDVDYYTRKEDSQPAFTLKEGTKICIHPQTAASPMALTGYGLTCWPDYEEEWRYGCPFVTENALYTFYTIEEHQKYYVKTKQLEQVARAYYRANRKAFQYIYTPWDAPKALTQYIDRVLYEAGAFCPQRWK